MKKRESVVNIIFWILGTATVLVLCLPRAKKYITVKRRRV